jgi:hypothetical protein
MRRALKVERGKLPRAGSSDAQRAFRSQSDLRPGAELALRSQDLGEFAYQFGFVSSLLAGDAAGKSPWLGEDKDILTVQDLGHTAPRKPARSESASARGSLGTLAARDRPVKSAPKRMGPRQERCENKRTARGAQGQSK